MGSKKHVEPEPVDPAVVKAEADSLLRDVLLFLYSLLGIFLQAPFILRFRAWVCERYMSCHALYTRMRLQFLVLQEAVNRRYIEPTMRWVRSAGMAAYGVVSPLAQSAWRRTTTYVVMPTLDVLRFVGRSVRSSAAWVGLHTRLCGQRACVALDEWGRPPLQRLTHRVSTFLGSVYQPVSMAWARCVSASTHVYRLGSSMGASLQRLSYDSLEQMRRVWIVCSHPVIECAASLRDYCRGCYDRTLRAVSHGANAVIELLVAIRNATGSLTQSAFLALHRTANASQAALGRVLDPFGRLCARAADSVLWPAMQWCRSLLDAMQGKMSSIFSSLLEYVVRPFTNRASAILAVVNDKWATLTDYLRERVLSALSTVGEAVEGVVRRVANMLSPWVRFMVDCLSRVWDRLASIGQSGVRRLQEYGASLHRLATQVSRWIWSSSMVVSLRNAIMRFMHACNGYVVLPASRLMAEKYRRYRQEYVVGGFGINIEQGRFSQDYSYVFMPHNTLYTVRLINHNLFEANCYLTIDGKDMGVYRLGPKFSCTIERPRAEAKRFLFVREDSNEAKGKAKDADNGIVHVVFVPVSTVPRRVRTQGKQQVSTPPPRLDAAVSLASLSHSQFAQLRDICRLRRERDATRQEMVLALAEVRNGSKEHLELYRTSQTKLKSLSAEVDRLVQMLAREGVQARRYFQLLDPKPAEARRQSNRRRGRVRPQHETTKQTAKQKDGVAVMETQDARETEYSESDTNGDGGSTTAAFYDVQTQPHSHVSRRKAASSRTRTHHSFAVPPAAPVPAAPVPVAPTASMERWQSQEATTQDDGDEDADEPELDDVNSAAVQLRRGVTTLTGSSDQRFEDAACRTENHHRRVVLETRMVVVE